MKKQIGLMSAVLVGTTALAADGIKLGGFVDAQYHWEKDSTNTFGLGDGAIYLGKTMGMGEVMVDVPFAIGSGASIDAGGGNMVELVAPGMMLGGERAQAWVSWKYDNGFMWKLGQFDGWFGFEGNDSVDRFFTAQGKVSSATPTAHHGLALGYDFSDAMGLMLFVGNEDGMAKMTTGKVDSGLKLSTSMDGFNASLGAYFTAAATEGSDMMFDIMAGTKMGELAIDVEAIISKPKVGDTGFGFMAHLVYEMSEDMSAGARVEYLKDFANQEGFGLAVGPDWHLNKDFKFRLDYDLGQFKAAGDTADATTTHGVTVSAVHRF